MLSRADFEERVQRIRDETEVDGEIKVFESEGLLVATPTSGEVDFLREELGDRERDPRGLWRKNLKR